MISKIKTTPILILGGLAGIGMIFLLISVSNDQLAYSGIDTDPLLAPIPTLDFEDPSKSMVVSVFFNSGSDVSFESAHVGLERAKTHVGDPPLILVQILDKSGNPINEFNSWHPLWDETYNSDGTHTPIVRDSGIGNFIIPFDPNMSTMKLRDIVLDEELVTIDLTETISDFCEENPDDLDCQTADLEITSVDVITLPSFILVGESSNVIIQNTMTNNGPATPVDSIYNQMVINSPAVQITPEEITRVESELTAELRQPETAFLVECIEPGFHAISITIAIEPFSTTISDPYLSNNDGDVDFAVDCAISIIIDIKPTSDPNSFNCKKPRFNIPVAILSTDKFDALTVNPQTVTFGKLGVEASANLKIVKGVVSQKTGDFNEDGLVDQLFFFTLGNTNIQCNDTEGKLRGLTFDGTSVFGQDDVRPVKGKE